MSTNIERSDTSRRGRPLLLLAFFFALMTIVAFILGPSLFLTVSPLHWFYGWLIAMGFALATALSLLAESISRVMRSRVCAR